MMTGMDKRKGFDDCKIPMEERFAYLRSIKPGDLGPFHPDMFFWIQDGLKKHRAEILRRTNTDGKLQMAIHAHALADILESESTTPGDGSE